MQKKQLIISDFKNVNCVICGIFIIADILYRKTLRDNIIVSDKAARIRAWLSSSCTEIKQILHARIH